MNISISDSEMKVMEKLWACGHMISVADVVAALMTGKIGHIRQSEHF